MQHKSLRIRLIIFLTISANVASAQYWLPLGKGTNKPVTCLYADTIQNLLYAGGDFATTDGKNVYGIAAWDGHSWHSLNGGLDLGFGLNTIVKFNNEIIVSGDFNIPDSINSSNIAKWDGTTWHSFNGQPNGVVTNMLVYNGELYVCGTLDSLGKINAHGIGKWDGNNWYSLGLGNWLNTDNDVYGMAFYNDTLYISGLITDTVGNLHYLAWYDGTLWHYFQDDIKFAFESFPYQLAVYNGELYVGGILQLRPGIMAITFNDGMAHNGTTWAVAPMEQLAN